MKSFWVVLCMSVCFAMTAHAATVDGFAYLTGQQNHGGTKVLFNEVSPSAQTDSTYTNADGGFAIDLQAGVYDVIYSHEEYATYRLPNQILLWDTTLDPVTLLPPLSGYLIGTLGPGDFQVTDTIEVLPQATLTIQPGTRLFFEPDVAFLVRGGLLASGTLSDSIVFSHRVVAQDTMWGGIQFLETSDSCRMEYCLVEFSKGREDYPDEGGAVFVYRSEIVLLSSTFRHNRIGYAGGAVAIFDGEAVIVNCVIAENDGNYAGGGVYLDDSDGYLWGCRVADNTATFGGGMSMRGTSYATITQCQFVDNRGIGDSGIEIPPGTGASITGCLFQSHADGHGPLVSASGEPNGTLIQLCTFIGRSGNSMAELIEVNGSVSISSCAIYSILGSGIQFDAAVESQVRYCDVFAPEGQAFRFDSNDPSQGPPAIGVIALTNANGDSCDTYYNIFMDPQFADTANGDYHLTAGSPCIDAGDPDLEPDPDGTVADMGAFYFDQLGAGNEDRTSVRGYQLAQNYPNPFNSTTRIEFDLPRAGEAELRVFDVTGRVVRTLASGPMASGHHEILFDAGELPSGVYFCQLDANAWRQARKMVLIR